MYFTIDTSEYSRSTNSGPDGSATPAELVGRSVLEIVHEDDREEARRHLAKCAKNPEQSQRQSYAKFIVTGA
jgi:hypothetical protein